MTPVPVSVMVVVMLLVSRPLNGADSLVVARERSGLGRKGRTWSPGRCLRVR